MIKSWGIILLSILSSVSVIAQGILLQPSDVVEYQLDRTIISKGSAGIHPALRYYDHFQVGQLLEIAKGDRERTSFGSTEESKIIYTDSSKTFYTFQHPTATSKEKELSGWKRWFFSTPSYLFSSTGEDYFIRLNPIIHFRGGSSSDKDGLLFRNVRGLEVSGGINDRFFFFTNIVESQSRFAHYVDHYIEPRIAIPQNGFYKRYQSSIVDLEDAYDYLNSTGYLAIKATNNVGFTLGHGRHFIGNGIRSVLLSDFTNNYFYLQADWKFWKIHYRNIWSEVKPRSSRAGLQDEEVRRKYLATHHLSIAITPKIHFGLFETVVFDRSDQFELGYLNPIILYRTVEQSLSSPDNVLLGIDFRWDAFKRLSFYGQINFDEFVFQELIVDNRGWWANKYAWQLGMKYINAFSIPQLDVQFEWNGARPYTYSHRDSTASYSHSNLAMAHPLGANFRETIVRLRYQPSPKWFFNYTFLNYTKGLDAEGLNYGGNILLPHDTRLMDFDNELGQGLSTTVNLHQMRISYELFPKFFLDVEGMIRSHNIGKNDLSETIISGGVRWNFNGMNLLF